jgi:hypothetical protein
MESSLSVLPDPLSGVEKQLSIDGVADVTLESSDRFHLGLALCHLALKVRATSESVWRIWQMAAMCRAWLSLRFPRRESRCTTRPAEENSTGAVPL